VTADLDGATGDDGEAGEGDSIGSDVEILTGGLGDDVLTGNAADNQLYAYSGSDSLNGGAGNDRLDGGSGPDLLAGGAGSDTAWYFYRNQPLVVDLDGAAGDDGQVGEHDTVAADVENIAGGYGNDVLTGNAGPNSINGNVGADQVHGLGGNDFLTGDDVDPGDYADGGSDVDFCWSFTTTVNCEDTVDDPK
jgi:Ca2+-binding RTX toxin-like protein